MTSPVVLGHSAELIRGSKFQDPWKRLLPDSDTSTGHSVLEGHLVRKSKRLAFLEQGSGQTQWLGASIDS